MKKIISLSLIGIVSFFIISCNSNSTGNNGNSADSSQNKTGVATGDRKCPGSANYRVIESEGRQMMERFDKIFKHVGMANPLLPLSDSVWIDASVIDSLSKYLEAHHEYDGIRIFNCAYDKLDQTTHHGQKYDYETSVLFQLTSPSVNTEGKPGHRNEESARFDFSLNNTEFKNFNLDSAEAAILKRRFDSIYRKTISPSSSSDRIDSLSIGVWFATCVISEISEYLKNQAGYDGVWVYSAAYDKKIARGQIKDIQSTFVIALTQSDGKSGHKPDWKADKNNETFADGFNHGDLCPDICN